MRTYIDKSIHPSTHPSIRTYQHMCVHTYVDTNVCMCDEPCLVYPLGPFGHFWLRSSFVINRSLGTYEGPATLYRRPPSGLVAWRRNGRTVTAGPRTSYTSVKEGNDAVPLSLCRCIPVEPLGAYYLCYFPIHPSFLTFVPFLSGPESHLSSPREEGSEVLLV